MMQRAPSQGGMPEEEGAAPHESYKCKQSSTAQDREASPQRADVPSGVNDAWLLRSPSVWEAAAVPDLPHSDTSSFTTGSGSTDAHSLAQRDNEAIAVT